MTPLALFLLGCATVFFGTVQAAFSALMRLSLRLMAERGGRSDRLGPYLDDPLQLFARNRADVDALPGGIREQRITSRAVGLAQSPPAAELGLAARLSARDWRFRAPSEA